MLLIGSQCVNKKSQDLGCQKQILFPTQLTWHWSMNMTKILSYRFQQGLWTFIMLLFDGSSETGLFRHLSDYVFGVRNFRKTKSMTVIFFFKYLKFIADLNNSAGNWAKDFFFWDYCVWIGIVKLSLLRRGFFSLAANVVRSSQKIWHVRKRDFFQLNWLCSDQ